MPLHFMEECFSSNADNFMAITFTSLSQTQTYHDRNNFLIAFKRLVHDLELQCITDVTRGGTALLLIMWKSGAWWDSFV